MAGKSPVEAVTGEGGDAPTDDPGACRASRHSVDGKEYAAYCPWSRFCGLSYHCCPYLIVASAPCPSILPVIFFSGVPLPYFLTKLQFTFIVLPEPLPGGPWKARHLPPAMAFLSLQAQSSVGLLDFATEQDLHRAAVAVGYRRPGLAMNCCLGCPLVFRKEGTGAFGPHKHAILCSITESSVYGP